MVTPVAVVVGSECSLDILKEARGALDPCRMDECGDDAKRKVLSLPTTTSSSFIGRLVEEEMPFNMNGPSELVNHLLVISSLDTIQVLHNSSLSFACSSPFMQYGVDCAAASVFLLRRPTRSSRRVKW